MTTVKLTWVEKGTRNAACLGLDETVTADSVEDAVEAAEYHAECQGIDLDRYDVEAEVVKSHEQKLFEEAKCVAMKYDFSGGPSMFEEYDMTDWS